MIFSAARFVVVDDNKMHLRAITETFERIGTPCLGVHYDPSIDLDQRLFSGVRCLFMDLHLVSGQAGSDDKKHFAAITSLLEQNISPDGGPFVLIVWTAHPQQGDGLSEYLNNSIDPEKPHARPLAVFSLSKEPYISIESGETTEAPLLQEAVQKAIVSNPQLAALLGWESDVLRAAGDTLASLLALVSSDQRTTERFPKALDTLLSRMAKVTVGKSHIEVNPRAAISMAFGPILSDRILNQTASADSLQVWEKAVTLYADKNLGAASPQEAGEINRMLHLAVPGSESLRPTDWGAVVQWPFDWTDDALKERAGLTRKQMLCDEFRMRSAMMDSCKPVLVRVGAACDYAQNNRGPITFLFGFIIPESAERKKDSNDQPIKLTQAIWKSPVFIMPSDTDVSRLYVHIRFPLTHLPEHCENWTVRCRLREQLLMHLISAASTHVARPGIVQL